MSLYEKLWNSVSGSEATRGAAKYGLLRIKGGDAVEFLQRICSQDVASLEPGKAAWAAFLSSKGRLEAVACLGLGAEGLWLECPLEVMQLIVDLLDRYHFAEDLSVEQQAEFAVVEIAGPAALAGLDLAAMTCTETDSGAVLFGLERHGQNWARCYGPQPVLDALPGISGLGELPDDLAECLRMLRGELLFGSDADAKTLPLEAGLDDHLSTTKGCYIGQEIVARIHTYGHVNRALTLLRIEEVAEVATGTTMHALEQGGPVGRITSSVVPPGANYRLALGYLPEAFRRAGGELRLGRPDGPEVRVLEFGA